MRAAPSLLLLLVSPAAVAWLPCEQKGITPPVAIVREAPAYPVALRATQIQGLLEIGFTVLRDGRVGWVRVLKADPRGYFEQAATEGVRRWRFKPASLDGEPVECRMRTRVRFTLTETAATTADVAGAERPQPVYPAALLQQRIEGYAEVEYELDADGAVRNARVIAAMPRGEFENAALAAVRGSRGAAASVPTRRETRRFDFRLPDSGLEAVPATVLASAAFPIEACERHLTGHVALEVETEASGKVRTARILVAEPGGLFDATALAIARGSQLSPAYRDGQPIAARALLTLFFDPERANCPGSPQRGRDPPARNRPPPKVTRLDEQPGDRAERWRSLFAGTAQPVP
jgi:TonB family protein